ncbi:unnamed protein product [Lymnaea stagnalis]|uniref:Jerky protein homolog-like n=1 Tax=Lymnaea stagnalis TaxID=6523 RepID=A0AAV2IG05_LYMST
MSKRKRVVLTLHDKVNIIQSLRNGDSGIMLAEKYGVGKSTISDIKKNSELIMKFTCALDREDGSLKRKTMKKPQNDLLEDAVFTWFLQKRSSGKPISGPSLCEKALEFNQKLDGDPSFKASSGWLGNFKSRHGIREMEMQGEKVSANPAAVDTFTDNVKEMLQDYDLDFVYNADETGLNWKALPSKSLASQSESSSPGHKVSNDLVTVIVCANASGSHKLPLFLIGKSKMPRNLKIPLTYTHQKKAWTNTEIFLDWYDNTFIPEVKKFQNGKEKEGRVLLLLDNAPSHPSVELLERENGMFTVKLLPHSVASVLQPMDQGIIETFKRLYRKHLLCQLLLLQDDSETEMVWTFYEKINLKDCCYMLVDAWSSLERRTLTGAWNKILKLPHKDLANENIDVEIKEIIDLLESTNICKGCDTEDVKEWLNCDISDPGFHILTDEEIIEDIKYSDDEDTEAEREEIDKCSVPSHAEACQALEMAFSWLERQEETDPVHLLQLKRIRDLAATKRKENFYVSCQLRRFFNQTKS